MNKKILIVTSEFPPMPGGIGNHAYCLAKELRRLNYMVTVLTEQREGQEGEWRKFAAANCDIQLIGIARRRLIALTYLHRILILFRMLCGAAYQAVIYSGKFSVWLNAVMPRARSIVVIHGSEIKQRGIWKRLFHRGLNRAKIIVCVSSYTKNQLLEQYKNLESGKLLVINNGFQHDLFNNTRAAGEMRKAFQRKDELNLVTVGGIHRRKGQFNVVRALPEIIKTFPQTKYRVVGLPVEKDKLLDLIKIQNVPKYVSFYHGLADSDVRQVLHDSDVFIMLSEHLENGDFEGFGIAAMEAMALGLPAVGSRNSGIADAIRDGYSGKLVNPQNPLEVVDALWTIVRNYETYSANARKWAQKFQWKRKAKEYAALIEDL